MLRVKLRIMKVGATRRPRPTTKSAAAGSVRDRPLGTWEKEGQAKTNMIGTSASGSAGETTSN